MRTKLNQLAEIGQSVWLDYIRRSFTLDGGLARLVTQGVRGVTSNPAIFEKAIAGSDDYDGQLRELMGRGLSSDDIYEALALEDIRNASDTLRSVYEATDGLDGYVSLEVSPDLAYDTAGTVAEARRLFAAVGRPNVFIKVPATPEGIPAIQQLIAEGININVTLIFSQAQYEAVAHAYIAGLAQLAASGGDLSRVASVASLFVSRLDANIDPKLDIVGTPQALVLRGKIALANAKIVYQRFKKIFQGSRWQRLAVMGARYQRPLWASTSTKDPDYSDTLYVDNLIGPHTVNTVPPHTLDAFLDHGTVARSRAGVPAVEDGLDESHAHLEQLASVGVDLDVAMQELLDEGVAKFIKPFRSLMKSIDGKVRRLSCERGQGPAVDAVAAYTASLGSYTAHVDDAIEDMATHDVLTRIKEHDYFVWQPYPTDVADRLGWLEIPATMRRHLSAITELVDSVRADGLTDALLLGMGGSSLASEVFSNIFGPKPGYLRLSVLDSTDPGAVLASERRLNLKKTLFIVSSKSGGTAETLSLYRYFYNRVAAVVGPQRAGEHFIAITDPGSQLILEGKSHGFRAVVLNDPTIGGRNSALSFFGLIPAGLLGVELAELLDRALAVRDGVRARELGATYGELAKAGRDKLTLVAPPQLANFGDWAEQLVAESTGKDGIGVLPVVDEPLVSPEVYGDDRFFVILRMVGDPEMVDVIDSLIDAGHPVVEMTLRDRYDIGEQIYLWEMATAIAGHRLGIQPFNQPNVEAAKVLAKQMIATYAETGTLPDVAQAPATAEALDVFLQQVQPGDYIALQAYVTPTDETTAALRALRLALRDRYQVATTMGYGPRYLHSTGQLHKGDGGNGLFIQFTAEPVEDALIPDAAVDAVAGDSEASSISFGVLIRAQALGDQQALLDSGRRVIRFDLGRDVPSAIRSLV